MAKEEHVRILLSGVKEWNKWRGDNPLVKPNLIEANLSRANLSQANLRDVYLSGANLHGADLRHASLIKAFINDAYLADANLSKAYLNEANLRRAVLNEANLSEAYLIKADLRGAYLSGTNFRRAYLNKADLRKAVLHDTLFISARLDETIGLDECIHRGPSRIDYLTPASYRLPINFLRGCGLLEWQVAAAELHNPNLSPTEITDIVYKIDRLRNEVPIQIHNLFISYSHADNDFIEHLERPLRKEKILFWRDVHDAPAGPLERIVIRAMRQNPTVLLVLSKNSVESDWVEYEAQTARQLEKELDRNVLCPIALDDSWNDCEWSAVLRHQIMRYNILDFSQWQEGKYFDQKFNKLLEGLDLYYRRNRR